MTDPVRILLLDDSDSDANLISRALRRADPEIVIEWIVGAHALRDALATKHWDAVLSDWSMPGFSALDALAIVRTALPNIPFILVSGTIGEEGAVQAMRAGANDYVLKDKLARLAPAVEREIRDARLREVHRRTEARFRAITEKSSEAVLLTGSDGNISYASPAALPLFGLSPEELCGRRLDELVHCEDRLVAASKMERLRSDRTLSVPVECRLLRPDGTIRWISMTGTNLLDDPAVEAIVSNLRDITEHRSSVEALQVTEAALRATEEQLRQAQKMEAMGRLAGGVAHDFNNLLSVILSYSEMLLEDLPAEDPKREDIDQICGAGRRAADLTRQLLMFSRQQVLQAHVMDINEVTKNLERMLRRILGEDIELIMRSGRSLGRIEGDPSSIEQVIMNLVVNARDAMPTGGTLTLETANVVLDAELARAHVGAKAGPHVMIAVTDTGLGMSLETQARIFEPFFTTKPKDQGTGLGLSTVFGIVHQSGGIVLVESEVGVGTTFRIYLPRFEGELTQPGKRDLGSVHGTETVLLVEDEKEVRGAAREILQRFGYRVIEAQNGTEALRSSGEYAEEIHLLLTDMVMPLMSGPELIRQFELLRPNARSLCMSGYTDDSVARHGILTSDLAFLQKPFTPASLARRVRDVLDA